MIIEKHRVERRAFTLVKLFALMIGLLVVAEREARGVVDSGFTGPDVPALASMKGDYNARGAFDPATWRTNIPLLITKLQEINRNGRLRRPPGKRGQHPAGIAGPAAEPGRITKASPLPVGTCPRNCSKASRPPAEAPMPTMGNHAVDRAPVFSWRAALPGLFGRVAVAEFMAISLPHWRGGLNPKPPLGTFPGAPRRFAG